MIGIPAGSRIYLACGHTDMRNYAECKIMLSPQRPVLHRRGFGRASLHIILGSAALLQHGKELVRRPEPSWLQEWRTHRAERFELFRRVGP